MFKISRSFKSFFVFFGILCFFISGTSVASLSLNLCGDPNNGYNVSLCYDGNSIAHHKNGGELSFILENCNHTLTDEFIDWKPMQADVSLVGRKIKLSGQVQAAKIGGQVAVEIVYTVINNNLVRKDITLTHLYGPKMFYRLTNALEAAAVPSNFWTFSTYNNSDGGVVREPYPAVGFKTNQGLSVGLLTDNGFKNQWTRGNTMVNFNPALGLVTIDRVPDENLTQVAILTERQNGQNYVAFNFGGLHLNDVLKNGQAVVWAYNPLDIRAQSKKTLYIFAAPVQSQRELKIACQSYLADGKGFEGTLAEKILYADTQMLTWIDEPQSLKPYPVPSLSYQMLYQRDAFWITASLMDKEISETAWNFIKLTQGDSGAVNDCYAPYRWIGGVPGALTDSNIHWIIWAYVNKMRYGTSADINVLSKNLQFIRNNFCVGQPGEYLSVSAGWYDVVDTQGVKVKFAHMQGEFAIALRCAKALGLSITQSEVDNAVNRYRNCYDPNLGYIPLGQTLPYKDMLAPTVLFPEFMSYWLFNEPMLNDTAVVNTLDSIDRVWNKKRAGGYAVPCIIRSDGQFQSQDNEIFAANLWWEPGIYANGGSYLMYEYMAYVAGHRHGWQPQYVGVSAVDRMNKRLELELSEELEPVSHEYIPMTSAIDVPGSVWDGSSDLGVPGYAGSKVFGWNSFVIIANEVAGIRQPTDPIIINNLQN